jgi:hypothetical protein
MKDNVGLDFGHYPPNDQAATPSSPTITRYFCQVSKSPLRLHDHLAQVTRRTLQYGPCRPGCPGTVLSSPNWLPTAQSTPPHPHHCPHPPPTRQLCLLGTNSTTLPPWRSNFILDPHDLKRLYKTIHQVWAWLMPVAKGWVKSGLF